MTSSVVEELKKSRSALLENLRQLENEILQTIETHDDYDVESIDRVQQIQQDYQKKLNSYSQIGQSIVALVNDEAVKSDIERICVAERNKKYELDGRVKAFLSRVNEVHPEDSSSQVGSNLSSSSDRLKAKAEQVLATMRFEQLNEQQELEEKINALRRQKESLQAKHEKERATAQLTVYEQADQEQSSPFAANSITGNRDASHQLQNVQNSPIQTNQCYSYQENSIPQNRSPYPYPYQSPVSYGSAPTMMQQDPWNQNPMMHVIANQQNMMQSMANALLLPKPLLMKFDGNPLNYWQFIRNFDESIHNKASTENEKLNYLLQFCEDNVKQILRNCVLMDPMHGYYEAKRILHERYGDPYVIACASVAEVTEGSPIRTNDRKGLQYFADKLKDCELTLSSIGFIDEINSADNLRKIAERFPMHLKGKWLERVRQIREVGHRPRINDLSTFVAQAAKAANDPIFGEILSQQKDAKRAVRSVMKNTFAVQSSTKEDQSDDKPQARRKPSIPTCHMCNETHQLSKCKQFLKSSYEERIKFLRSKRLCDNCFKAGHIARNCFQKSLCTIENCDKKHHTVMHPDQEKQESKSNIKVNSNATSTMFGHRVCLPIVPVRVYSEDSKVHKITYALLDQGSDTSLCTKQLAEELGVKGTESTFILNTVASKRSTKKGKMVTLKVKPMNGEEVIELPTVMTIEEIPVSKNCRARDEDIKKWSHLDGIELPEVDAKVSLLIGNDVPEVFWMEEERRGERKEPYAIKSILGWTVHGPMTKDEEVNDVNVNICLQEDTTDDPLLQQLRMFWESTETTSTDDVGMSVNDKKALKKMEETVTTVDGHYQMRMPWKEENPCLINNKYLAESRLKLLKKRLEKDDNLYQMYKKGINEYLDNGYAREVPPDQLKTDRENIWYLPHHPVINPNKPGKVRVVFDCAAKYKGMSLNSLLLQGPDLTNSLFGVLSRFRQDEVALMADIEGMFNQVKVDPADLNALRFLWWKDGDYNLEPVEMQMMVHLFGATSSPSCANFALHKTAEDNKELFQPETSKTVNNNFYVDDLLKSTATAAEAIILKDELEEMLKRGGFHLTKWASNSEDVMETIPECERAKSFKSLSLDDITSERALGVIWDVNADKFRLKTEVRDKPCTRRGILSVTSSIFDPIGIASPFILPAKKLMQDLCRTKCDWDEQMPEEYTSKWNQWLADLPDVSDVSIDRCIKPKGFGEIKATELHTFADASEIGYGAVVYLRLVNEKDEIHCAFMAGRSRLAPLKSTSIPRLELSAAVLAVELASKIKREIELKIDESIFWTDSTAVLQYINNESRRFKVFVANRISRIHEGSNPDQWRHVKSADNPADDASRGLTSQEMLSTERWLKGPAFLRNSKDKWPTQPECVPQLSQDHNELKKEFYVQQVNLDENCQFEKFVTRYSNWYSLKKATAWLLRYKAYIMSKYGSRDTRVKEGSLTVEEIQQAEVEIIKYEQRKHYKEEITRLKSNSPVQQTSNIIRLNPQVKNEVMIVGGRLGNAAIEETAKHQIILPKDSHVSNLLVNYYHELSGHCGKEHVLSLLREKYWIVTARVIVRKVLSKCMVCKRQHSRPTEQLMADLPEDRVTPNKSPFTYVGVDCFGPMLVKQGRSQVKRYGCIFTCLTTRAVHLEVLHNMDTDSFINGLNRFISRRGKPEVIRCDNGTNFKGSQRELSDEIKKWNQTKIQECLKQQEIKWKFNPPAASNFGGAWERLIRSVKTVLRVLLKNQVLTDEVLSTLLIQVEGIMNSRPITPYSDDPKDKEPLTPNHLLLMRGNSPLPSGIFKKEDAYRRRWKQVQFLADQFWKRWIKEYLPNLQERQKWLMKRTNLNPDDLVLIFDEKTSRGQWPLGRVVEVYKGRDGLVRSAKIAFKDGVLHRPVNKLCLVEKSDTSQPSIQEQDTTKHPGTRHNQASRNKTSTKHPGASC